MEPAIVRRRELEFMLYELLNVQSLTAAPRYAEHSRETFDAALDAATQIAAERFAPHQRRGDLHEPHVAGGRVVLIPEVGEALRHYARAGFLAATFGEDQGGMQLPRCVANACWSLFKGANLCTETYASLSIGVAEMLQVFGSAAQKARYLPPLLAGRFFGTMALTEPQAGSSLAEIQSSATPLAGGHYAIKGHKIFITAGDHELGENIVHLVLARIAGAPPGVKGLSLFIVPKYRVELDTAPSPAGGGPGWGPSEADGVAGGPYPGLPPEGEGADTLRVTLGRRNDVALAGLIHKMGCRGTTSAMLNFGERGDCVGELLGEPNQGLACMFQMMNEARINVGLASSMLAMRGYLHALAYARERVQGRATPDPRSPPVPIVRHADVRRMLLTQKCVAEGGLALCLFAAQLADLHEVAPTEAGRHDARLLLDLLTPVVKAWCASRGTAANSLALQVHGGCGYTRDLDVEQLFRDNRLNSIHEGTDGMQALDLLGRKVGAQSGAGLALLGGEIERTVASAHALGDAALSELADRLQAAWAGLRQTSELLLDTLRHEASRALAHASVYLDVFGDTVIAWMWLRQAVVAQPHANGSEAAFYRGKLAAAHHFFHHELPLAAPRLALLRRLDPALVDLDDAWL